MWRGKKNPANSNLWVVGYWERKLFGLCICSSISVEQTEMRGPKIILKTQRAPIVLCGCHDLIFIGYLFLHFTSTPFKPKFCKKFWLTSFSAIFTSSWCWTPHFRTSDILFYPLTSWQRIRLIACYYCPEKSYTFRRKDVLPFMSVLYDIQSFSCLFCIQNIISPFPRLYWFYLTVLTPWSLFTDFAVRHSTTYFPVKSNSMSSLISWYCLCKLDCQISLAASEELLEKQWPSGSCPVPALKKFEKDALNMRIVSWQQTLKNTLPWINC